MSKVIAILPGDGIGPEIVREARRVLEVLQKDGLDIAVHPSMII